MTRDGHEPPHGKPRRKKAALDLEARGAPLLAIAVASFLVALKGAAAFATGSLALGATALDSLIDVFVSAANFFILRRAAAPPDEDHAYGHGRFEDLAALGQGIFLGGAAIFLVTESVKRLASGAVPARTALGATVLGLSMAASLAIAAWLRRAARRTASPAIAADAEHYATDIWTNGAALVAILVVHSTGWSAADPLVALGVAFVVFRTAAKLVFGAMADLSDRGLPEEDLVRIREVIHSFEPRVSGFHDLRTRKSGSRRFIEFHLEIPRTATFEEAHDLMVEVLRAVERELPRSKVFVHGDPVGPAEISTSSQT